MPYTKQDLITLYNLDGDEVNQTLTAAGLCVDNESYTDEQIQASFELIRSYFSDGQVSNYTAAAQLFEQHQNLRASEEQQPKSKKSTKGKKSEPLNDFGASPCDRLNVLELIALASEHCGVKIELLEAVQIMPSCGLLPNQSEFTQDECDRFVEACNLIKKQNKAVVDVAVHNSDKALIKEINGFLDQASFTQADQIRAMLPRLAVEQLQEIKAMFWQMTAQRLRQHVESGDLEAEIREASSNVLNSGNSFGLLTQYSSHNQNQKNLLGSSTNASINE